MALFKVGDVVRKIKGQCNSAYPDKIYTVVIDTHKGPNEGCMGIGSEGDLCHCQSEWVFIRESNPKEKNMGLIEKFALALKGEPEKSFIKTGILDSSEIPTDEGVRLFVAWALKQKSFSEPFKKDVVDVILADEAEKK